MAYNMPRSAGLNALWSTMKVAVQWRLLLLWLLIMLIPATVVALPLWRMLGGLLDSSVHATEWAQHFSAMMLMDVVFDLSDHAEWLGALAILGLLLTLLLSPFLNGMIIGSGRAGQVLGCGALLQNGLIEYGRMFRLMLWSLPLYGLLALESVTGAHMANDYANSAVLESHVDMYSHVMYVLTLIVFVVVHSILESARAAFIADVTLRSATRALWRGIKQLIRRPLRTLLFYVVVTVVGLLVASVLAVARLHVAAAGGGFLIALVLSQLIVVTVGWMRVARLFALAEVARTVVPVRV
jgi:hypothetical protein